MSQAAGAHRVSASRSLSVPLKLQDPSPRGDLPPFLCKVTLCWIRTTNFEPGAGKGSDLNGEEGDFFFFFKGDRRAGWETLIPISGLSFCFELW